MGRGEVERGAAADQREAGAADDVRDERARARGVDAVLADRVALIRVALAEAVVERAVVAARAANPKPMPVTSAATPGAAERQAEDRWLDPDPSCG